MNEKLLWECIRELLLDPQGTNKPKRVLLAEMIDTELTPSETELAEEQNLKKRAEEIKVEGCGKELHHEGADCLIKCGTIHFGNIELCKKCKEKGSDFEVKK